MNHKIANLLKGYIDDLTWVDKIAGLVQTANIRISDKDKNILDASYPISCDITADACKKGAYQDLAPDSKKKSVLYFEDKGVSFVERTGNRMKLTSNIRLVCWLNLCRIDDSCGVSGDYVLDVIKALPTSPVSNADFISIMITGIEQAERSVDIFSKYTYHEQTTQYLMYPYDYFALDLTVAFTISCLESPYVPVPFDHVTADSTIITVDSDLIFSDAF